MPTMQNIEEESEVEPILSMCSPANDASVIQTSSVAIAQSRATTMRVISGRFWAASEDICENLPIYSAQVSLSSQYYVMLFSKLFIILSLKSKL
jgi:hypothetical protein